MDCHAALAMTKVTTRHCEEFAVATKALVIARSELCERRGNPHL